MSTAYQDDTLMPERYPEGDGPEAPGTSAGGLEQIPSAAMELRVRTGLQSGAALPLDQWLSVGQGADCDVLLLDDGVPEDLLRIGPDGLGGHRLEPLVDDLLGPEGLPVAAPVAVTPGQVFGFAGVWLEVRRPTDAWDPFAAPMPQQESEAPTEGPWTAGNDEQDEAEASVFLTGRGGQVPDGMPAEPHMSAALAADGSDPWMLMADGPVGRHGVAQAVRKARWSDGPVRWLVLGAGGLLTTFGLVAMAVQLDMPAVGEAEASPAQSTEPEGAVVLPKPPPMQVPVVPATEARNAAGNVAGNVAARAVDKVATGRGATDKASAGHMVLVRGDLTVTLPFDVREVVMGARSRVVLSSGQVLEPGEAVGAWRLVEVRAGTLVFDGPERVLVPW